MTTIYLSGPMTGLPQFNYKAFNNFAELFREHGLLVENPAENPVPACGSWQGFMRLAVAQVAKADVVVMLEGWKESRGARIEYMLARNLDIAVLSTDQAVERFVHPALRVKRHES